MTVSPHAAVQVGAGTKKSGLQGQILCLPLASLITSATFCLSFPTTEVIRE